MAPHRFRGRGRRDGQHGLRADAGRRHRIGGETFLAAGWKWRTGAGYTARQVDGEVVSVEGREGDSGSGGGSSVHGRGCGCRDQKAVDRQFRGC